MRELVYYAAVTLDGFIAGPGGEFDAFLVEGDHMDGINARFADTLPTVAAEALGIPQRNDVFDTVLMGRNTYEVGGLASPYRHLRQIVFSRTRTAEAENLEVTAEDPVQVVRRLKRAEGGAIWLCGGGALAATLADEIDRLILKRQPLLFGSGIPLFGDRPYRPERFEAVETTPYESGVVVTEYVRWRGE
ncbi:MULTISPECIES: dihydrofolate reductase family protein [Microbacterium]|jgi:dihydrofolate reductase|uniref:dihydrofolate reductase family protein n=1 Tax=Microbacterium TaxID=33882 RepID=UPI0004682EAE|nr:MULTISPECIES: dihydrofolate reductase family protein [Microbacterium]OSP08165.1 riboflavin biosynthesis protein RibD [Microbacterium sp. LEMMJ01]QXE29923.1 dihydrofolate reductase [Microbacterium paraoxydans]